MFLYVLRNAKPVNRIPRNALYALPLLKIFLFVMKPKSHAPLATFTILLVTVA